MVFTPPTIRTPSLASILGQVGANNSIYTKAGKSRVGGVRCVVLLVAEVALAGCLSSDEQNIKDLGEGVLKRVDEVDEILSPPPAPE